jgi:hypothetical protein
MKINSIKSNIIIKTQQFRNFYNLKYFNNLKFSSCFEIQNKYGLFYFVAGFLYIQLVMGLPLSLNPGAGHDDGLFLELAKQFSRLNWLGEFNQMTLAKGPGFPILLAINRYLLIPISLSMAFLWVYAVIRFIRAFSLVIDNKYIIYLLFLLILFHPALFPFRVLRDSVYSAFVLLSFVPILECWLKEKKFDIKYDLKFSIPIFIFWVLREEGIWVLPGFLFLVLSIIYIKKDKKDQRNSFLLNISTILLLVLLWISIVASINKYMYGSFQVVDFKGGAFSNAVKKITSIEINQNTPFLPVPEEKRKILYEISPSFARLKNYFEVDGKAWTEHGCSYYPTTCGDYAYGWFLWAFRDAVASIGLYKNASTAEEFYKQIIQEVDLACNTRVKCKSHIIPFMPVISLEQVKSFPAKLYEFIQLSYLSMSHGLTIEDPSNGEQKAIAKARIFYGNPLSSNTLWESQKSVSGWYSPINIKDWFQLSCKENNRNFTILVERFSSKDVAEALNNQNLVLNRFSFKIPLSNDCKVIFDNNENNTSLNDLPVGKSILSSGIIFIDKKEDFTGGNSKIFIHLKKWLVVIYSKILPIIFWIGSLSFFIILCFFIGLRSKLLFQLALLPTFFWILYYSRILLLTLIDISSFPALSSIYVSAAYPLLILASFISLINCIKSVFFIKQLNFKTHI